MNEKLRKILNGISLIIVIFMIMIAWGTVEAYKDRMAYDVHGVCYVREATCEKIGKDFDKEIATPEYDFYRFYIKVQNTGQYMEEDDNVYFRYIDDEGRDCTDVYISLDQDVRPVIPAGRTATLERVVRVPVKTRTITVSMEDYASEESSSVVVNIP